MLLREKGPLGRGGTGSTHPLGRRGSKVRSSRYRSNVGPVGRCNQPSQAIHREDERTGPFEIDLAGKGRRSIRHRQARVQDPKL